MFGVCVAGVLELYGPVFCVPLLGVYCSFPPLALWRGRATLPTGCASGSMCECQPLWRRLGPIFRLRCRPVVLHAPSSYRRAVAVASDGNCGVRGSACTPKIGVIRTCPAVPFVRDWVIEWVVAVV